MSIQRGMSLEEADLIFELLPDSDALVNILPCPDADIQLIPKCHKSIGATYAVEDPEKGMEVEAIFTGSLQDSVSPS
jgi:hypothetical protein